MSVKNKQSCELTSNFCHSISSVSKEGEFDICVHKKSKIYKNLVSKKEGEEITISGPYGKVKYLGCGMFYE